MTGGARRFSSCPVCEDDRLTDVVTLEGVPVLCNALFDTVEQAQSIARGDLALVICESCGHVFNAEFDPEALAYDPSYDNSLHHSPRFSEFAEELAERLIADYRVRGQMVMDVGCGNGEFLRLLCEVGANRGIGFDPSYDPLEDTSELPFQVVRDYFSKDYSQYSADLVCCRHVLEHVVDPASIMSLIREAGGSAGPVVYVEVPSVHNTFERTAIWDLIYEHFSYFSCSSMHRLFARAGLSVKHLEESFGGQYIGTDGIVGVAAAPSSQQIDRVIHSANRFKELFSRKIAEWESTLDQMVRKGRRPVIWGAGSKGVTILNLVKQGQSVEAIVDINPKKHGRFVPGTGQPIISPDSLVDIRPDVIVVMNPIYLEEIRQMVSSRDLRAELIVA